MNAYVAAAATSEGKGPLPFYPGPSHLPAWNPKNRYAPLESHLKGGPSAGDKADAALRPYQGQSENSYGTGMFEQVYPLSSWPKATDDTFVATRGQRRIACGRKAVAAVAVS